MELCPDATQNLATPTHMSLDISISVTLAALAFAMAYLGVRVTLHPTESRRTKTIYKLVFWGCALVSVVLIVWQGIRNGRAQGSFARDLKDAKKEAQQAHNEVGQARQELKIESARRQQAEQDLAILVTATGRSTRQGVVEDIKRSPIKVEVSGHPIDEQAGVKLLEIRTKLGQLLSENNNIKNLCLTQPAPAGFSCLDGTNKWAEKTRNYLSTSMETSYLPRFDAAAGPTLNYGAAANSEINGAVNYLTFKATILQEFIKENTPTR